MLKGFIFNLNFTSLMWIGFRKILSLFKNKYILTAVVFLLWLLLFDSNNLLDRFKDMRELNKLRRDKEYYLEKTEQDSLRLNELKTDNANLEKFAREQYLMKRDNEDIFVVVKKEK